jgi:D-aminopeptidase
MIGKVLSELQIHNYFYYPRGKFNAITDVDGVKVGHSTIIEGQDVRTGVSVVVPPVDFTKYKLVAGGHVYNANGDITGLQYILEEARLISPIFLTNTFSIGDVYNAVVDYYHGDVESPVIGECWDGYLNDIRGRHVKPKHVYDAINNASSGLVSQGNFGAGTGMSAFGFKAGIGTSSRKVELAGKKYHIGVLVNNNLGNETAHHWYLRIGGIDVGKLYPEKIKKGIKVYDTDTQQSSTIIVIATDIPMDHHQLNRVARRAILGMGRIGAVSYTGSGDFVVSFSTANQVPLRGKDVLWQLTLLSEGLLEQVFEATIEATEEAFLNSLLSAEDMTGFAGHQMLAIPIEKILNNPIFK